MLAVEACRFEHNAASLEGGAIVSTMQRIVISNSSFMHNSAFSPGGAVSVDTAADASVSITHSTFQFNSGQYVNAACTC